MGERNSETGKPSKRRMKPRSRWAFIFGSAAELFVMPPPPLSFVPRAEYSVRISRLLIESSATCHSGRQKKAERGSLQYAGGHLGSGRMS